MIGMQGWNYGQEVIILPSQNIKVHVSCHYATSEIKFPESRKKKDNRLNNAIVRYQSTIHVNDL